MTKNTHRFFSLILIIAITASGCSTVFGRQQDDQMVTFDANVKDVEINCSGKRIETPGSLPLKQSKSHSCTAVKEGYEKKAFRVRSGTSWAGFGHSTAVNTAIWGWWTLGIGTGIGWLIDWPSGAMRNLKEENFYLEMKPEGSTGVATEALSKVVDTGKTVLSVTEAMVQNTSTAVLGNTLSEGAQQMGVTTDSAKPADSATPVAASAAA